MKHKTNKGKGVNGVNVEEKKNEEKDPQVIIGACRISQELAVDDCSTSCLKGWWNKTADQADDELWAGSTGHLSPPAKTQMTKAETVSYTRTGHT